MKRIIAFSLLLILLLGCASCSEAPASSTNKYNIQTQTQEQTTQTTQSQDLPQDTDPPEDLTAVRIGEHKISDTELTYFYVDGISNWYSTYGNYAAYFGLDVTKGLDKQYYDQKNKETWADYFLDMALESAKNVYALCDEANRVGFQLSDDMRSYVDELYDQLHTDALAQGQTDTEFLQDYYGKCADESSYKLYYEATVLASCYYNDYCETLRNSYTPEQLRAFEGNTGYQYNSYSFAAYYLSLDNFKMGGTKDSSGNISYSDAELEAAQLYLEWAKNELSAPNINTLTLLNQAIAVMDSQLEQDKQSHPSHNATNSYTTYDTVTPSATEYTKVLYSKVPTLIQEWIRDSFRKPGDITALADESISTAADGTEIKTLKGYYIVLFQQEHDNFHPLANARHILIAFEGGTYNSLTGTTTYSDAEKAAAYDEATNLLEQWINNSVTEDSFADLANMYSDDGDGTTGGLYEDIYPGQMVTNFNDWCFDESRKPGDVGIVESIYGYHIMYYVGHSDQNYRDYMVANDKLEQDITTWQEALLDSITLEIINTDRIDTNLVLDS